MCFVRTIPRMVMGFLLLSHVGLVWASGGDDHTHGAPGVRQQELLPAGLGHGGVGDLFEVVITPANDGSTRLYLSELATNAPVAGATVAVEAAGTVAWKGKGEATPMAGVYRLAWTPPSQETAELTLTVSEANRADLILLQIPASAPEVAKIPVKESLALVFPTTGGLIVVAGLVWWLRRMRRKAGVVAVALLFGMAATEVRAHGGEEHGTSDPQSSTTAGFSTEGRSVTLAKASQFLLEVRTVPAEVRDMAETIRLVGRVIPDPAAHARIHPQVPSRIGYDPDFPPPRSGQRVKRGQTLAVLDPVLSTTEKAGQRMALFKGERLEGTVGREMILAPIDGQLTDLHIVPGEVVGEGVTLAEIIDPARLWVEAVLYDLPMAERISGGMAVSRQLPGKRFPLRLVGVSPKVNPENQGLHLQFAVAESFGMLKPGMPMDVYAQTGSIPQTVVIPRAALIDQGEMPLVWVKSAPERFAARPVRVGQRTAEWAEILIGVQAGDKVVVQGHNQLNAMR